MLLTDALAWLTDPENWTGQDGIPHRTLEHLVLSGAALAIAVIVAVPLGLFIGHSRRGGPLVINVGNVGRAIPTLALLGLLSLALGFGSPWPTIISLALLAIPPILTNTFVGIQEVDAAVVQAGTGMGLSSRQVLWQIEAPLSASLMLSGIRTSAVQVVATGTLAALVAQGGLGRYVIDGLATGRYDKLVAGAILVALLALAIDGLFALLALLVDPMARVRRRIAAARTA